ncbi:hypothetical protein MPSEU_000820800 [Mayamaea pseudoterrestris]|nr:hypothetical protein MPSEU_000820800 [Mayamaea pseudoterrestris]
MSSNRNTAGTSNSSNSNTRRGGAGGSDPSRQSYRPVLSNEGDEEDQLNDIDLNSSTTVSAPPLMSALPGRRQRRPYQTLAAQDEEDGASVSSMTSSVSTSSTATKGSKAKVSKTTIENLPTPSMTLILLDGHQTKFRIPVHPSWTVAQFKTAGSLIHKVPVSGQRIFYRGKLLADDSTLEQAGINAENTIVHLFPKPRVILEGDNGNDSHAKGNQRTPCNDDDGDDSNSGGAHVPTIVLNADEAERRSQILVLGSVEYMEAQSNVKLFSFMLLMISTMELLNLLAIFMGVPQEEAAARHSGAASSGYPPAMQVDDVFVNLDDDMYAHHYNGGGGSSSSSDDYNATMNNSSSSTNGGYESYDPYMPLEQNPWGWINLVDLCLSLLGVYVALVGIRAASETRLALARVYLMGTVVVGVGWMLFNYYLTVRMDQAMQDEQERDYEATHGGNPYNASKSHPTDTAVDDDVINVMTNEEIFKSALSVMVLPGLVWFMCCLRAAQFHNLLREAEMEASTRIQSQMESSGRENGEAAHAESEERAVEGDGFGRGPTSSLPAVV